MNKRFETINLSYLNDISGGDTSFQIELITIFLNQVPEFIANMDKFLSDNELENLAKEAHSAKSSALIFMMDETGENLRKIQHLAVRTIASLVRSAPSNGSRGRKYHP